MINTHSAATYRFFILKLLLNEPYLLLQFSRAVLYSLLPVTIVVSRWDSRVYSLKAKTYFGKRAYALA
jgi:hypothetical protein